MNLNVNIDFVGMHIVELAAFVKMATHALSNKRIIEQERLARIGFENFVKEQDKVKGRIHTIQEIAAITGFDLAHAKDVVEHALKPLTTFEQIQAHVKAGNLIAAIKCHRMATNCGLKDAKDYCEKVRHDMKLCGGAASPWCQSCKDEAKKSEWKFRTPKNVQVFYLKNYWVGKSVPEFNRNNYFRAITLWATGLDEVFNLLNDMGRPRPRFQRSMSVGDVVQVDNKYWRCEGTGWKQVGDELPF